MTIEEVHEALGDEYLKAMASRGVVRPPAVAWITAPPDLGGRTFALICWEDGDQEVHGPRDMLPALVVQRVLARAYSQS